jgi:hypothetical protein
VKTDVNAAVKRYASLRRRQSRGKCRRGNVFCRAADERGSEARRAEGAGRNQHGFSLPLFAARKNGAAIAAPCVKVMIRHLSYCLLGLLFAANSCFTLLATASVPTL